jgi:hypothetical protein
MVIVFDKNIDPGIISCVSNDVVGEKLYLQSETHHAWTVDETNFRIRMGADDSTVNFSSKDAMTPYLDQFMALTRRTNPYSDGIRQDPYYDKPKTGEIVPHTYVHTDIERTLIEGQQ